MVGGISLRRDGYQVKQVVLEALREEKERNFRRSSTEVGSSDS